MVWVVAEKHANLAGRFAEQEDIVNDDNQILELCDTSLVTRSL
jgi:hypothetical protein